MEKSLKLLRATQILFCINATTMLFVGVLTIIRSPQSSLGLTIFTAILMLIDATLLAGCTLIIAKRQKWPNLAAVTILITNILLTVLDEFGLVDMIVLIMFIVNLVLLFLTIKQGRNPTISQA